jgi:glycosyltransferase involved in cell wall biosynthesis
MIVIITSIPAPYQVELFDGLAEREPGLRVIYVWRQHPSRSWVNPLLRHQAMFLDEVGTNYNEFFHCVGKSELVVFADYSCSPVREAMRRREAVGKPWCFWGERPGFHGLGELGRFRRRLQLAPLHRNSHVPIWGIGKWAVDGYREEFGATRLYYNVSYFSDLQRFRAASAARCAQSGMIRILYSGALIKRKGVDLLARAFGRVAKVRENVTLSLIGAGPLNTMVQRMLRPLGSRVHFHGFVPWQDLPKFYAQADILCVPSRYDGWGMVVPEGLASGLPVISTTRVGAALDLIQPGKNGWIVPAGDEDALFRAMLEAVSMGSSKLRDMSEYAKQSAETHNLQAGTDRFLDAARATMAQCSASKTRD